MPNEKILIIDDDPQLRMLLKDRLEANGYRISQAEDGIKGLEVAIKSNPDLILLDLNMPEMDGFEVLNQLNKELPEVMVIILTAHGSIERAVEAMKLGAYDFLPKPSKPDHILIVVKKALERKNLKEENLFLRNELDNQYKMITGESSEMKKILDIVHKTGKSKTTMLIQGETGTGKQLMARYIHAISDRSKKPFIQVNCTTLSEQLMESDLFGHEKGAFTGAIKQKIGRFELADTGTLFLDEIGELSSAIQAKLLQVLEYGEFQRVGGTETHRSDVRIIVATNRDLQIEVNDGRFREDLFYRLNVLGIQLPPLRSRQEDITIFADYFIGKYSKSMLKNISEIMPNTMAILEKYSWPGNIRELENVIERAVVLATGDKITSDLLPPLSDKNTKEEIEIGASLDEAINQFKKKYISKTLESMENNQTRAAELLKIQRTYLSRLIKEMGVK